MAGGKNKKKSKHTKKHAVEKLGSDAPVVTGTSDDGEASASSVTPRHGADPRVVPGTRGRLTEMVPVRFDAQTLGEVKRRAADDHRSVSSWIRRAVDLELDRTTS